MAFMQKLPRDRLTQAQFAALSEFNHPPNGLAPVFAIEAPVLGKTRQRRVEHLFHRAVETAGQLLLDDLLLLRFEFNRHNFTVASSPASCKLPPLRHHDPKNVIDARRIASASPSTKRSLIGLQPKTLAFQRRD